MENYKKVDTVKYVSEGIKSGMLVPVQAVKYARIVARPGVLGEEIISWSVDSEGNEVKERVSKVSTDATTGNPGWVVTKVDEMGNTIIDKNGHSNQWIIEDSKFVKKYEVDPENPALFRPTGGVQVFVEIPEDLTLFQWGGEYNIARGGYINITNPDDMYGISERDFDDTYRIINQDKKTKTN